MAAYTDSTGLINNEDQNLRRKSLSYGTYENHQNHSSSNSAEEIKRKVKGISVAQLFRFATKVDLAMLAIGTIFTIIHGAGIPLLALVFGRMTNVFIHQTVEGFAHRWNSTNNNETSPTYYMANETLGGISPAFKTEGLYTRGEFLTFMENIAFDYIYIGLLVFIASLVQAMCWEICCERQTYRLRKEFFRQIMRQEIAWFDHHQSGELAMKLSDDLERVREGIGHKFSMIIQYVATFVCGFAIGFSANWQLTLVILALTPLLAATSAYIGRDSATRTFAEQQRYGVAGAVANEVLTCIRTVASFGGEEKEIRRYESALQEGYQLALRKANSVAIGISLVFFIMYGSYSLAFWYGCDLLEHDLVSPGGIFTVFFSVLVGAFALGNALPHISTISIALGSGALIFDVIDSQPGIDAYSLEGFIPDSITGEIQFQDLCFQYPLHLEVSVLQDVNIYLTPGKTVAIVGASGSGKSTIVSLILRFYDPQAGKVLLDGINLRDINLSWLRHNIAVVSEEPVLFGTTVYENISYGRDSVVPSEVVTAAKLANAHDFIIALPDGYQTMVGERGAQLNGGQKQRIAIARALVRDPKILILDEATSVLDARSEAIVQASLDTARFGRTTIIIAHRLSTIKDADFIYTLKDGTVAEYGTHDSLMADEGLYFDMVTAQTSHSSVDAIDKFEFGGADSGVESTHEFRKVGGRRRRRTTPDRSTARVIKHALGDPDKSRLLLETKELGIKYPGMWRILKISHWPFLVLTYIGCVVTGAALPVFALFYAEMFASFSLTGIQLKTAQHFWSLMFIVLASTISLGYLIRAIFASRASEYLTLKLRQDSFINIIRQPISWFDQESHSPGRLLTRLARDAPIVKGAAGSRLAVAIASLVTIIASLGVAYLIGWQLAIVLTGAFPLLVAAGYIQFLVQKSGQRKDAILMEDAGRVAVEAIQNIKTVQSITQEKMFFEKYLTFLLPAYIESQRQGIVYGFAFAFSEAIIFMIYAGSFYYGGYLIGLKIMVPLDVLRVFFSISFCAIAVGQYTSYLPDYAKANMAAGLIFYLLDMKSQIDPFSTEGVKPTIEGRITFNAVQFSYPNRKEVPILNGLSFELLPGRTLAIVGSSGCGKSTVVSLLERFYDVSGGQVMIDGYDVRCLNVSHLRRNIGLVTQEPILFSCSIRDNIAYGYAGESDFVPDELIFDAAISANIHDFIIDLPHGYNTLVGERGTQLSGGQKQRIAIARALVRNPKILLLDEATSGLEAESEKIVQEALDRARAGRTCIVITHRLSTIQNADCIGVMSRGRFVELGTHNELRSRKGIYYKLTRKHHISNVH